MTARKVRSEDAPVYSPGTGQDGKARLDDDATLARAAEILQSRLVRKDVVVTCPEDTRQFLRLKLSAYPHEVFAVMFLDNRHRLIAFEEMFRGTIDGASVHPREVVRQALTHNAAAVVFAHNHPSGVPEPSQSDLRITQRLKDALALVDTRTLDHFIVGDSEVVSLAERGLV